LGLTRRAPPPQPDTRNQDQKDGGSSPQNFSPPLGGMRGRSLRIRQFDLRSSESVRLNARHLGEVGRLLEVRDEAIPTARNCFNKKGLAGIVAERLAQLLNVES